jgi:hypothetical protein
MANTYLTSNLISESAVAIFKIENSFIPTAYRKYENMFSQNTYKPGDTINVRLDNFYEGARGDSVTAESIVEASIPVTIAPLYSVAIQYRPTDLQRKIEDFADEFIAPATRRLAAMINRDIQQASLTQVNYFVGDDAANLNTFASLDQVNPVMLNLSIDPAYRKYASLSPKQAQQMRSSSTLQNSYVSPLNKDITMNAALGHLAGFDIFQDQSITNFTAGTHAAAGDITVKTAVASGSSVVLTGLNVGATFKAGDVFSIDGTYVYNQTLRIATSTNMQFTVLENATADGGGDVTLSIYPAIQMTGPRKNVFADGGDTQIAAGSVVNVVASHTPNICYSERGLIACMPPLQPMDSPYSATTTDREYGISIRVSKSAEVLENMNILRLDAQVAYKWVPGQAVRLISAVG